MMLKHGFEILSEEGTVRDGELGELTAASKLIHEVGGVNADVALRLATKVEMEALELGQRSDTAECGRGDGIGREGEKRPWQLKFNCCSSDVSVRQVESSELRKAQSQLRRKQSGETSLTGEPILDRLTGDGQ
jgi:hypothetical protein